MKPFVFEKVSVADAREVLVGKPRTTGRDDWSSRRAAANDDDELLQPTTLEWIYDLPAALQPHELAGSVGDVSHGRSRKMKASGRTPLISPPS